MSLELVVNDFETMLKVDQERKEEAERKRLEEAERKRLEEEAKKAQEKKNAVQNWVNNIAEENESVSSSASSTKPPAVTKKAEPKNQKAPPRAKTKYTTAGRRTSSMSGVDIAKKVDPKKVDLSKLPQPADLSVPFEKNIALKKTPKVEKPKQNIS